MRTGKLLIMVLLLSATAILRAQAIKITGAIKDSSTGTGLPNAVVTIKGLDTLFTATVLSDSEGKYTLPVPAQRFYTVEVTYIGYKTQVQDSVLIDTDHSCIATISLQRAPAYLQKVTVTAKKPFIVMGTNKITLTVAQSPVAEGSNAYDLIKKAPGVTEQNEELSFRGKSTRILINGRPANLTGEDLKTMLTNMQASGIEKIEILPNPSAKYDAQGGSVINIILSKNKLYGTNYVLTTGVGAGKYPNENAALDINYRNSTLNCYGGGTYSHKEQYTRTGSIRYLPGSQLHTEEYETVNRHNGGYKFGLDDDINNKSSFGFLINDYVNTKNRALNNTASLHYNSNSADSSSIVHTLGRSVIHSPTINLYYKTVLDTAGKELSLDADYMYYSKQWKDLFTNTYYDTKGLEYMPPDYLKDSSPAQIKVYAITADYTQPTKKGTIELGIKASYTITDNNVSWQTNNGGGWLIDLGKTNHFIYKENVNAVYGNYIASIKKWNIEAGLRIEQTNTNGNSLSTHEINRQQYANWFPALSIGYTKNENNILGFSYRKSIQRFGFDYVNPFIIYQNQYAYKQGNPRLQPQINNQLSLNYTLRQNIALGVDYTHATRALGVSFKSSGDTTISSYANFKGSDIVYAYINYTKTLFTCWQLNANLSAGYFSYNVDTSDGTQPQNKKPIVAFQAVNIFNVGKQWNVESNIYYSSAVATGVFIMQAYYSAGIGISKTLLKRKVNLKFSLADIFNSEKTNLYINYQGVVMNKNIKEESRFASLVIKYAFGNKNVRSKKTRPSKLSDINSRITS